MAKIDITGTNKIEYKAVEVEPNGKINAVYGSWIEFPENNRKNRANQLLANLSAQSDRRGQTATSRVVLLERVTQTRTTVIG